MQSIKITHIDFFAIRIIFICLGSSNFIYNINSEDTEIPFPVIVVCAENEVPPPSGYNTQVLYKKNIMFRNLNISEMIKTVKEIKNSSDEFWYSRDEILEKCTMVDGIFYFCEFGNKAQETEIMKYGQKRQLVVVAVKGSLHSYYMNLNNLYFFSHENTFTNFWDLVK
jgi:hypothetical protein